MKQLLGIELIMLGQTEELIYRFFANKLQLEVGSSIEQQEESEEDLVND